MDKTDVFDDVDGQDEELDDRTVSEDVEPDQGSDVRIDEPVVTEEPEADPRTDATPQ